MTAINPYLRTEATILEPPTSLLGTLKYVGPGFILSASIVGSGELIATTRAGAEAGFILMWFIIFSCIVKVAVQLEFGKHAIVSGQSTMASFNALPGPRLGKANWSIWTWLILMSVKMLQLGGIVGSVVLAFVHFFPGVAVYPSKAIFTFGLAISVSLLVYRGYYQLIEKASLVMLSAFTLFTIASLVSLQFTGMAITASEFGSGLVPSIPSDTVLLLIAIGAFGITGVGGDEIMAYNYWLIEKGYASYTGPRNDSEAWERRARGWIRVMRWDALLAMVAYTSMTVMFYLLGAAVLHRKGLIPEGDQLLSTLGDMYTESLGAWARSIFIVGAIVVLYSTLFAALAAWTRMFADAFGRLGCYDFQNEKSRKKAIAIAAWALPLAWATLALLMGKPALMVILGGLATVVILLIVVFATIFYRYRHHDTRLNPSKMYDFCLWLSAISIFLVAAYVVYDNVYRPARDMLTRPVVKQAGK